MYEAGQKELGMHDEEDIIDRKAIYYLGRDEASGWIFDDTIPYLGEANE